MERISATEYRVRDGEELELRVDGGRNGQLEIVSSNARRVPDADHPGYVYLFTPRGAPKDLEFLVIECTFLEKLNPSAKYRFALRARAGGETFQPSSVTQPLEPAETFPRLVPRRLTFVIA